jgi:hypothetical protein
MQSVQTVLPYGCHFLDNTTDHIIGLRDMRGHGEMLAVRGESTANCVMAWNTQRLQRAVERESQRTALRYSIDALRSIGPVGHRHINFRGTDRFPVKRYANSLVASAA